MLNVKIREQNCYSIVYIFHFLAAPDTEAKNVLSTDTSLTRPCLLGERISGDLPALIWRWWSAKTTDRLKWDLNRGRTWETSHSQFLTLPEEIEGENIEINPHWIQPVSNRRLAREASVLPDSYWIGVCLGFRACLDVVMKREICTFTGNQTPGRLACSPGTSNSRPSLMFPATRLSSRIIHDMRPKMSQL
jgi:hypothetical protein